VSDVRRLRALVVVCAASSTLALADQLPPQLR
jgi:hypothetical protein